MRKSPLACLSMIVGWTAGFLAFSFTQIWVNILGFILVIISAFIINTKFCNDVICVEGVK